MTMLIKIINDGKKIKDTNYFDTEHAKNDFVYFSFNAGCARLLLPDGLKNYLNDIKTAKYVIISLGNWQDHNRQGIELLFEDGSDSPFSIHLATEQCDRTLTQKDDKKEFDFKIYTRDGEIFSCTAKFRLVDSIPNLTQWE